MKKLFSIYFLIAIGVNCFAQDAATVSLNEAIRSAMEYLTEQIAPGSKVVVLNFSAPTEALSNYIIEDLGDYIVNSRTLTVVDRQSLEEIRRELNFQMSGEVSDETAQRIGGMLGAQSIISGAITPLGNNYRFRVQAIGVETAAFQGSRTINVTEDATLATLLGKVYKPPRSPGSTFAIGAQAGTLYGLFSEEYPIYGIGDFGFLGSLYGAFSINSTFRLQLGANIAMNNINTDKSSNESTIKYPSLDIPLLANFYIFPSSNFLLRIGVGPYVTIPFGELEIIHSRDHRETYEITPKANFGLIGGFGAGYRIGNGNIVLDLRYLMDFMANDTAYSYDFIRRGITAVVGYEHWF